MDTIYQCEKWYTDNYIRPHVFIYNHCHTGEHRPELAMLPEMQKGKINVNGKERIKI